MNLNRSSTLTNFFENFATKRPSLFLTIRLFFIKEKGRGEGKNSLFFEPREILASYVIYDSKIFTRHPRETASIIKHYAVTPLRDSFHRSG